MKKHIALFLFLIFLLLLTAIYLAYVTPHIDAVSGFLHWQVTR